MEPCLRGKVVVLIGGTTGLGLSAAKACVAAGANVVAVGRDAESREQAAVELGEAARTLTSDAIEPATAPKAIQAAIKEFGGFHGLYHVAGGSGRSVGDGPLHEMSDQGWQYTLNLNLTSVFNSNRAAVVQFMSQNSEGSILNMGSVLANHPSPRYFATHAYAATKAAIEGFTRSCAAYYAPRGIRFNVVAPALVDTPMAKRAVSDDAILKFIQAKQPLDGGRVGQGEDLDAAVVYFLSDGSKYCTGQVLAVDGGWGVSEGV